MNFVLISIPSWSDWDTLRILSPLEDLFLEDFSPKLPPWHGCVSLSSLCGAVPPKGLLGLSLEQSLVCLGFFLVFRVQHWEVLVSSWSQHESGGAKLHIQPWDKVRNNFTWSAVKMSQNCIFCAATTPGTNLLFSTLNIHLPFTQSVFRAGSWGQVPLSLCSLLPHHFKSLKSRISSFHSRNTHDWPFTGGWGGHFVEYSIQNYIYLVPSNYCPILCNPWPPVELFHSHHWSYWEEAGKSHLLTFTRNLCCSSRFCEVFNTEKNTFMSLWFQQTNGDGHQHHLPWFPNSFHIPRKTNITRELQHPGNAGKVPVMSRHKIKQICTLNWKLH